MADRRTCLRAPGLAPLPIEATGRERNGHIWRQSQPARGTLAETYLRSRGIDLPPPDALRFHPGLKHPSGGTWPAMVAQVTRGSDGTPIAVHRTFLACDGRSKAPVNPAKMMLGPCRGGVVRLAEAERTLVIGEGIETALSAMQASGIPAWAALSAGGIRSLVLPPLPLAARVTIAADPDPAGIAAAVAAAERWYAQGREVRISISTIF